jgi:very-short-patch-repair endonuclease
MRVGGASVKGLNKETEKRIRRKLSRYSRRLNKVLPKAEQWFWGQWGKAGMHLKSDYANSPFGFYIPDVINRRYCYIVEVDEDHHNEPIQKEKDSKKDSFYEKQGYKSFRVKAYDVESFNAVVRSIKEIRLLGRKAARRHKHQMRNPKLRAIAQHKNLGPTPRQVLQKNEYKLAHTKRVALYKTVLDTPTDWAALKKVGR